MESQVPSGWVAQWHRNCDCVEVDGVKSLPASECDWPGHESAVDEAGFCPVCQH